MKQMFVLVRRDLTPPQQAVQGGHALAQFALMFPDSFNEWDNRTLIYLGVKDEFHLERMIDKICKQKIYYAEFFEPDLNNEITAVATYANERMFRNLNLL